jgi:hypothetical protein
MKVNSQKSTPQSLSQPNQLTKQTPQTFTNHHGQEDRFHPKGTRREAPARRPKR